MLFIIIIIILSGSNIFVYFNLIYINWLDTLTNCEGQIVENV